MRRAIVIPARYGSTRLAGKPLVEIAGKPLVQWVYERASASALKDEVLIATDDERIRKRCADFGAEVVMTGRCRSGTDRVCQAIRNREADIVVNLQGDEPEIRPDMIDALFRAMEAEELVMATLCSKIGDPDEYESPHVVKCVFDRNNFALYFSRAPLPFLQRPASIPSFKHIGVYAFTRPFLETFVNLPEGRLEAAESLEQLRALEAGYRIKVILTEYDGVGVDTEADLERAAERLARLPA